MAKLELSYEMERALGRNRKTVLALWYKIEYFQNKYGFCDKTNPDFARMLGISLATVKRCLEKLIELGLISKVKSGFWHRKLFAVRPVTDVKNNVNEPVSEPVSEPIYNKGYKNIKNKNNVVSIKEETTLKEIEIEILKDEFEEEIVSKSIHVFNMAKKEKNIFNPFKYTRGICLNILKNKRSLERKQAKKEAYEKKQLQLFEEIAANRSKIETPAVVDPNYYYDWMAI